MGFVFQLYFRSKGFLHITRGVEGFYVQGGVVGKVRMSSNSKVLLEIVGVFEIDRAFG